MIDEDEYMAKKLHEHLDDYDYYVSNCCGEEMESYIDICPNCGEHCEVVSNKEREYEEYENAMCDKADSERELAREEN